MATRRILKEIKDIKQSEEYLLKNGIQFKIDNTQLFKWIVVIAGPEKTPYENGFFHLLFKFPTDYPFREPTIKFLTPIKHPNVHFDTGEISGCDLDNNWSPAWTI